MIQSKTKIKKSNPPSPKATAGEERSQQSNKRTEINPFDRLRINTERGRSIKSIKEEVKNMTTKDILEKAKKELADLTGFKSPSAIGFKKEGNELIATIEVIEKESIPDGMDVLGTYEVRVDDSGKIISYERTDLRKRVDTTLSRET